MSTATLTISSTYVPSPDPVNVPSGGKLEIKVPTGGCLICLYSDIGGEGKWLLTADKTFDLKDHPDATVGYDVLSPTSTCPARARRNAHSIKIGSGK